MKKLTFLLLLMVVLAIAAIYYLIPDTLTITETAKINCVADAAFRTLSNENTWSKWWPGQIKPSTEGPARFQLNTTVYTAHQKMMNNFGLLINYNGDTIDSHMSLLNLPNDSCLIKWQCSLTAGRNPFQRIKTYREALALKENMHTVIVAAQTFLDRFDNIYGFTLKEASTKDTALITTKSFSASYPSTAFVYSLIDKLRVFCQKGSGIITGIPMLNVTPVDTAGYQVMVALPVERYLATGGDIKSQKMIPGRFIITDVTGGPHTIKQIHLQLLNYFRDYHRTSMAIPFEYLVTDRLKETDTSKWITRIYSPVY